MRIFDYIKWKISRQMRAQYKLIQLPQSKMVWDIMQLLNLVGAKRDFDLMEQDNELSQP